MCARAAGVRQARRHGVCSVRPFQIVTGRYLSPVRSKVSCDSSWDRGTTRVVGGGGRERVRDASSRAKETDLSTLSLRSIPLLPSSPPSRLTLTPLRYLTYLRASCHPTVGTILPGSSALRSSPLLLSARPAPRESSRESCSARADSRVKGGRRERERVGEHQERVRAEA